MNGPNPMVVAWSLMRARRHRRPAPAGSAAVDHRAFGRVLDTLASRGIGGLSLVEVGEYLATLFRVDPDALDSDEALAYWINLYNAGALATARRAWDEDLGSVLRVRGAFTRPFATVAGEHLSLDDVEHGKIRRFRDPRIHAALVCGSVSCPTLRFEPFVGSRLQDQLDDQMHHFLAAGGAVADRERGVVSLSRVFRWYGADFVRPHRMPTLAPVRGSRVLEALVPWLDPGFAAWIQTARPISEFQRYDWALRCDVRPAPRGSSGSSP